MARALLEKNPETVFPLRRPPDFAGRVVSAMLGRRHWICRHPDAVNIVYVEGMDPDGTLNDNRPNHFNDTRLILQIRPNGHPRIIDAWEATTEPSCFWTDKPMKAEGVARIAFGQYKAWGVGLHNDDHEALTQSSVITVFRDLNKDFRRTGDRAYTGHFSINQHRGYDNRRENIDRASAGCLVGRAMTGHRAFMAIVKTDPRYVANNRYQFMTAVLDGTQI